MSNLTIKSANYLSLHYFWPTLTVQVKRYILKGTTVTLVYHNL